MSMTIEQARENLGNAVELALEAGMPPAEVKDEVAYLLEYWEGEQE
jgi:hypothetical protein